MRTIRLSPGHCPTGFDPFRTVRQALLLALLLVAAAGLLSSAHSEGRTLPARTAVRRVVGPPDKRSAELERAKRGVLVQLPRAEFEDRVRRAAEAVDAVKNPPRLVEARYMARLEDTALVGTAEWKIVN